jgi:peptide chain release factor subunit 3
MDDPSVEWAQSRFDEIVKKTSPFLKQNGYKIDGPMKNVDFIPISGLAGHNVKEKAGRADWFKGPSLWEVFDNLQPPKRDAELPFRIPLLDGYKDMGAVIGLGKVEQGTVKPGTKAIIMPTKVPTEIVAVSIEEDDVAHARPGEAIRLKLKGVEEEQVCKGFVLCPLKQPLPPCTRFKAQVLVLELLEQRPLITAGYQCILHVHTDVQECVIKKLYQVTEPKTKKTEKNPRFAKEGTVLVCGIEAVQQVCVAPFEKSADVPLELVTPQLGRFTLRDEGRTIAIGKIVQVSDK